VVDATLTLVRIFGGHMAAKSESQRITEKVVSAYYHCIRKSYLLMFERDASRRTDFQIMLDDLRTRLRADFVDGRLHDAPKPEVIAPARTETLATEEITYIKTTRTKSIERTSDCEPVVFSAHHSLDFDDKTEVAFSGYIISRVSGAPPALGKVILRDGNVKTVRIKEALSHIQETIKTLEDWMKIQPPAPRVLLNRHCPFCEFQHICKPIAEGEDNLTQLQGISEREVKKFERKGIFTVKQLSFLYRPRKRSRRSNPHAQPHRYELQALALRTGKIYIQDKPPVIPQSNVEIYLDFETDQDADFCYLIGVLVSIGGKHKLSQYWADRQIDEKSIWDAFLSLIHQYPDGPIFHYGNFERKVLIRLSKLYGGAIQHILNRLFNVNTCIYGKIYFPTNSNGLKDICRYLGCTWTSKISSGLQSIVWHYRYEITGDKQCRSQLLRYNKEDCQHLKTLVETIREIALTASHSPEVRFADVEGGSISESASNVIGHFSKLLQSAHGTYDKSKIKLTKTAKAAGIDAKEALSRKKQKIRKLRITKVINVRRGRICPHHPGQALNSRQTKTARTILDLEFSSRGVKKVVKQYIGYMGYCVICKTQYSPPAIRKLGRGRKYGRGLQVWAVYNRMALRLPYDKISQMIEDIFSEQVNQGQIMSFVNQISRYHIVTEKLILKYILQSPVVHVDETTINIRGATQYVWVITDGKHVAFRLTPGRDAAIVHEWLDGYSGVLCSDFYGGYDSVDCVQQKCWAHLIRDLNDDLRKSPFDSEFEGFVLAVRDLIVPIFEASEKYNMKSRNLQKFKPTVEAFYRKHIDGVAYRSDLTQSYQKRFSKYKDKLFIFLERDGVPWNNNMAERAIRHLAVQRKISGSFNDKSFQYYLRLLAVTQTCRFQNKSLLQFLLSGERDVDQFDRKGHFSGWHMR
jgi:predicted RecB family nuclease